MNKYKLTKTTKKERHGMRHTRFYNIWCGMKARCFNSSSKDYKNYGSKGIIVCDKWFKFSGFSKDMLIPYIKHLEKFGSMDTTIERKDVLGNYFFRNCKWATKKEQANNKSSFGMDKRKRDSNGKFCN